MWKDDNNPNLTGFSTPQPSKSKNSWNTGPHTPIRTPKTPDPSFHVIHKVPNGDSPYVKAKHVQLIDKDPSKSISLFWSAINAGDRVDSAVKDMAIVMKQVNRTDEAIEAIKSFRCLCTPQSQESLDNVLIDLYKRGGRIEEHIELLQHKLALIDEGVIFGGKARKIARSRGRKVHVSIEQERSRLLGNLAWAYMQLNNYRLAEQLYREALSIEPDKNKQCNLAICLMNTGQFTEAKSLLLEVKPSSTERETEDPFIKSFDRANEIITELESESALNPHGLTGNSASKYQGFSSFKSGKNWADMVEEDEEELLRECTNTYHETSSGSFQTPRKSDDRWNDEHLFHNENTASVSSTRPPRSFTAEKHGDYYSQDMQRQQKNLNSTPRPPRSLTAEKHRDYYSQDIQKQLKMMKLEDCPSSRYSSARRSLAFEKTDSGSVEIFRPSPLRKKAMFNYEDDSKLTSLGKRRLHAFQKITP
ncbi:hypothetical protein ACHQM5_017890 [Ranunculus cassubicifolius]